jgi:hypothetical protein
MNEAIEGEFAWHVDAWDPLAGRAFAVWRPSEGGDTPELEYQSVFLGPPHFQPELVSARSLGIAAARASFQLGLFVDGAEVRFA